MAMVPAKLTSEQAAALHKQLNSKVDFFKRLCRRMDELGIAADDPVYAASRRARDAVQALQDAAFFQIEQAK